MVQVSTRCASAGSRWNTPLATGIGSCHSAGQVTVPEMVAAWVGSETIWYRSWVWMVSSKRIVWLHAAPGAGDFVVVGDAACPVGARDHRLGADPAMHGLGELEARAEQRRVLLDELLDRVLRQLDGARFEMAGHVLEERLGVVRDRRDLALQPLQQARSRRGGGADALRAGRTWRGSRPRSIAQPRASHRFWQARSASAVMVSSGFTPAAPGSAAPSQTYRPSCTASPSMPRTPGPGD